MVSVDDALTHFSGHSTPVLCPSKKTEHPTWSPICWTLLCLLTHVHKRVFYAKALTTLSRPICSLFISLYFLSFFHLVTSRYLPACLSSDFTRLFCFATLTPSRNDAFWCLNQFHAASCLPAPVLKTLLVQSRVFQSSPNWYTETAFLCQPFNALAPCNRGRHLGKGLGQSEFETVLLKAAFKLQPSPSPPRTPIRH